MKNSRIGKSRGRRAVGLSGTGWMAGVCLAASLVHAETIVNSKHNLSVSGPGTVRAGKESQVCIFCHTPHNATTEAPLWNRYGSGATYTPYISTTTKALIGQPTGSSKLCLSCHDGTVALGKVRSRVEEIAFIKGNVRMPRGRSMIGTDLSDDHPISFRFDNDLAKRNGSLYSPDTLIDSVHLDEQQEVQCTSCHDAHDDKFGKFLVKDNSGSALCITCHNIKDWKPSAHALSRAIWNGRGINPWPHTKYPSVAENACANCHTPHAAETKQRLLNFQTEEQNCYYCHNGNVAAKDVQSEFLKISVHPVDKTLGVHDPTEDLINPPRHVECADCHDAHQATADLSSDPGVLSGALKGVIGVNAAGTVASPIKQEYELCFRCHADSQNRGKAYVNRQYPETNTRREFDPVNASFHPIEAAGRNIDVPSLLDPWKTTSLMTCTDCHNNDIGPATGSTGPRGPHGSSYAPILERRVSLTDGSSYDPAGAALCYKCHSEQSIQANASFSSHKLHIDLGESCITCHDPHGSARNSNLLNFNVDYVRPAPGLGPITFTDDGNFAGTCTMLCHEKVHDHVSYTAFTGLQTNALLNVPPPLPSLKQPQPLRPQRRSAR